MGAGAATLLALSRVLGLMTAQLVDADELAVTPGFVALELVVRVVRLAVLRQVRRLAEAFAADLALERFLARVRTNMHCCWPWH